MQPETPDLYELINKVFLNTLTISVYKTLLKMKQSLSTVYTFKSISKTTKSGFQNECSSNGFVSIVGCSASDFYDCNFYMILIWMLTNKDPWRED